MPRTSLSDDFLWWRDGVIYQIYPRSFADSNGDGIGDLPGIIGHLDHLESLGVDAIWLSPIYPSPMYDFGYDVSNYHDIHPDFGTLEDFDRLLEEAHKRGIRIVLDWVANHTSHEHPWFVESRSSRDNSKRDWYIWRDGKGRGRPPNNWQASFGGPAWTWDEATGQYYLHLFLPSNRTLTGATRRFMELCSTSCASGSIGEWMDSAWMWPTPTTKMSAFATTPSAWEGFAPMTSRRTSTTGISPRPTT